MAETVTETETETVAVVVVMTEWASAVGEWMRQDIMRRVKASLPRVHLDFTVTAVLLGQYSQSPTVLYVNPIQNVGVLLW